MNPSHSEAAAPHTVHAVDDGGWTRPRRLRVVLWVALVVLLLAADTLLVTLAFHYRSTRTQESVEANAAAANGELARRLSQDL